MQSLKKKRKVVVAMSGGVDSSTVAAILKGQGDEVIGVTLKLCRNDTAEEAKSVAKELKIKHYELDLKKDFHDIVISYFINTYKAGETPNPCVKCNEKIKFGLLYDFAKSLGADALATGHYIRKVAKEGKIELHKATDTSKDQSYFLFALKHEKLDFLEFPLGGYKKSNVRKLAKEYGLTSAETSDSQDVCFVPNGNYVAVINEFDNCPAVSGNIIATNGNILGRHNGIINYTVGQRKGLGIATGKPLYVVKIDANSNSVIVGNVEEIENAEFYIRDVNWLLDPKSIEGKILDIKVRSTHKGSKATICTLTGSQSVYKLTLLRQCKSISPGQACVIYLGSRMLGGGIICAI